MSFRPPFPSSPPSQPSPYRYLGGGGGGEKPVRLQIILALVAGLVLVAVPLYLWRRPRPESIPTADAAVAVAAESTKSSPLTPAAASALLIPPPPPPEAAPAPVTLSPFTTLRCQNPGPGKTPAEKCDHVTFFEDGLAKAIRESVACAPTSKTGGTVSFVLETDFRRKVMNLYAGKSSTIKKEKTKPLIACVRRAMPTPDWATISHQYVKYKINVTATYPPNDTF